VRTATRRTPTAAGPIGRQGAVATLGVLASAAAIALLASRTASPITPQLAPGADALEPLAAAARFLGLEGLSRGVAATLGAVFLVGAAAAFVYALFVAWHRKLGLRRVILVGLILHALALILPLLFSRDVYSYTIYGRIVSEYGENPYVSVPLGFPDDPIFPVVSDFWEDSPTVYGPAFTAISAGVTSVADSPAASVFAFKALSAVASAATMLLVVAAARRLRPERAAFAGVLVGWNPVVVFHGVGGGHNDALVGLAIAGAVLLILRGKDLWATGLLVAGALVKAVAVVPLVVLLTASVARRPAGSRLRALGAHGGVALLVGLPFIVPFMQTEDPTLGQLELASREGWLAPSRFVYTALRGLATALAGQAGKEVVSLSVRVVFAAVLLVAMAALLRHLARAPGRIEPIHVVASMGWGVLFTLMLAPLLLPWYVAWVVPLIWLTPRPAREAAILASVALTVTELIAEPSRAPGAWEAMVFGLHWIATPVVLGGLVLLLIEFRRRVRLGPGPGDRDPLLSEGPGLLRSLSSTSGG
jgi:alpha-1,6-mannosyltransferase